MITIIAPEKATQQHCKWLRLPRGLELGLIQDPANRHSLYSRASKIRTSKGSHSDALLHTTFFFVCDLSYGMGKGCTKKQGNRFRHKKEGENRSSCC